MQNAKFSILAIICVVGLSILAGCQKPAKAPSMATEEKAPSPAANVPPPAPVGKRLGVVLIAPSGKPTSTPPSVTLNPDHNDRIVWVAPPSNGMVVTFNDPKMGSPFLHGSPGAPSNVYEVSEGEAVLSGPLKPHVAEGTYPYVVTMPPKKGAGTPPKDGDVIIKR